jgi:hypothetical protein
MFRYILAVGMVLSVCATTAQAQFVCTKVAVKKGDPLTILGSEIEQSTGKAYLALSTDIDNDIKSDCSYTWSGPLNNWLYGDEDYLYPKNPGKYGKSELLRVAGNRQQIISNNYSCTDGGTQVGYYAYSIESGSTQMKLEFLCTLKAEQGKGYGLQMMNEAAANANTTFTKKAGFRISLIAHPKAIGFYNGLDMDCSTEHEDDVSRNVYSTQLSQNPFVGLARKARCFEASLIGAGGTEKISYSDDCLSDDEYQEFLGLNDKVGENVIVANCGHYTDDTTYSSVKDDIDGYLNPE